MPFQRHSVRDAYTLTCHSCGGTIKSARPHTKTCGAICRKRLSRGQAIAPSYTLGKTQPYDDVRLRSWSTAAVSLLNSAWELKPANPARARLVRQALAAETRFRNLPIGKV